MSEQRPMFPPEPKVTPRAMECWVCAKPLQEIENGWGQIIARQCPCCHRVTKTGDKQPTKPAKIK